ncbi:MAG TPA: tRNA (5-methylaminomethyl-2-thiouridine)(34)-methyltransferase MnmD [Flavobacteriaceae bacterium]|nr:tRNA (5-methylaminomethyl-2-thiouridine)(34)-methyltransferase MnmD [Flavobacteriaceae bacterium]
MKREIFKTSDGSHSIRLPEWNEQYHSKHGAIQEAEHVFIKSGLVCALQHQNSRSLLDVLEMGFGTGLNALLTVIFSQQNKLPINYTTLEAYPVPEQEWRQLNFPQEISEKNTQELFNKLHQSSWEQEITITPNFILKKQKMFFQNFHQKNKMDVIYFDAFGPRVQPELWEEGMFKTMYEALRVNGVLVTYSAKGSVRRALQQVGFQVDKIPGPPGKREMLRAFKKEL